jgi:NAD(P)-dependent dehydrogenase (short-subunit alcohol dehydrogenase family)
MEFSVVANAGIGDVYKPLLDTDLNDIKRLMEVNFFGVFALIKAVVPLLQEAKDHKGPNMIFVGSGIASFAKS